MSPYLIVLLLLFICTLMPSEHQNDLLYYSELILLTLFLGFRFGQGTDWSGYCYIFLAAPNNINFEDPFYSNAYHSEFAWKLLMNIFKSIHMSFFFVSLLLGVIEMLLINRFISNYSSNRKLSLLLLYPTYYLTYLFSGMREGLVISFFLGIMIEQIEKKNIVQFELLCLILSSFHMGALVLCAAPLVRMPRAGTAMLLVFTSFAIGLAGPLWIKRISFGSVSSYTGSSGISLAAVLYRLLMSIIIITAYFNQLNDNYNVIAHLYGLYFLGLLLYLVFIRFPLIASRLSAVLCSVEIAILPSLLSRGDLNQQRVLLLAVAVLVFAMTIKNLDSYILQAKYNESVHWYNYPYISVLSPNELYEQSHGPYILYTLYAFERY